MIIGAVAVVIVVHRGEPHAAVVVVVVIVAGVPVLAFLLIIVVVIVGPEAERAGGGAEGQEVVVADIELRLVAVERVAVQVAIVASHLHGPGRRDRDVEAPLDEAETVLGDVGIREDRAAVRVEQLDRRRRVAIQPGVGEREADAGVDRLVPVGDVGDRLGHLRGRGHPPARLVEPRGPEVDGPGAVAGAPLRRRGVAVERPAGELAAKAGMVEAVLEVHDHGAAQRVQAVGRLRARAELHLIDGELRNQIELDGVAERLVDPDAVLVDGHALRQPQQRRGGEAPEPQGRLKQVGGGALQRDRAELLVERIGQRRRVPVLELRRGDHGHRGGHPVPVDLAAGGGPHADHVDLLGERREPQLHVGPQGLARGQPQAGAPLRPEACHRDGERVGAVRKGREAVRAGCVGRGGERRLQAGRGRRDAGADHGTAQRVGDLPLERGGLRLRTDRA